MQLINDDNIKKNTKKYIPLLCFLLLYIVHALFAMAFAKISATSLTMYFLYTFFGVFIPGLAITLFVNKRSEVELLFCESWIVGLAINILTFILSKILNLDKYILPFYIAISAVSIIAILLIKVDGEVIRFRQTTSFLIIAIVFTFVCMVAWGITFVTPRIAGYTNASYGNYDNLFWCSNSVAIKNSYPYEYLFFDGVRIFYHYFSSAYVAASSLVTGIDIYQCSFPLYSFCRAVSIISGAYLLLFDEKVNKKEDKHINIILLILILFASPFPSYSFISYSFLMSGSPGLDMGLAFSMSFSHFYRRMRFTWEIKYGLIAAVLLYMAMGSKAPVAIVVSCVPLTLTVLDILHKKYKLLIADVLCALAVISIIFITLGLKPTTNSGLPQNGWFFLFTDLNYYNELFFSSAVLGAIPASILNILMSFLVIPCFIISFFAILIKTIIVEKGKIVDSSWGFLVASIIGIGAFVFVGDTGSDKSYFFYGAMITAIGLIVAEGKKLFETTKNREMIFGIFILIQIIHVFVFASDVGINGIFFLTFFPAVLYVTNNKIRLKLKFESLIKSSAGFLNFLLVISLLVGISYAYIYPDWFSDGTSTKIRKNIKTCVTGEVDMRIVELNYEFDELEIEALTWIRENTPTDSIIVNNSCFMKGKDKNRSAMFGVFSERQQWVEGDYMITEGNYGDDIKKEAESRQNIVRELYNGSVDCLQTLKNNGVDYVVHFTKLDSQTSLEMEGITMVYSNNGAQVYKVD